MRDDVCNQAMDISASGMKKNECNACSKLNLTSGVVVVILSLRWYHPVAWAAAAHTASQPQL
jgi:hypothetical protein